MGGTKKQEGSFLYRRFLEDDFIGAILDHLRLFFRDFFLLFFREAFRLRLFTRVLRFRIFGFLEETFLLTILLSKR
jgi:hypothetical protein